MLRVKDICIEKGITLQELAKRLDITYQSLYESIKGNPSLSRLKEIANALGVGIADLFAQSDGAKIVCPHCGKQITIKAEGDESAR